MAKKSVDFPKVKFTDISLSKEVGLMYNFLFQDNWGWNKYIIKKHPKIKKVFSFNTESERIKFLVDYIVKFKKDNQKLIDENKTNYQAEWQKVEKEFFITLSEIIEISWPKNRKIIKAMISANPICPRFLKNWSFSIFYNYKKNYHAMEVIMHECCHFLYFEKWKRLYPKMDNRKFETPYLEWHLSEILAPIILNDSKIQKLLKSKACFYSEHQKIKIGNKSAIKCFEELYNETTKTKDFDEFLKKSYLFIKKNRKMFEI